MDGVQIRGFEGVWCFLLDKKHGTSEGEVCMAGLSTLQDTRADSIEKAAVYLALNHPKLSPHSRRHHAPPMSPPYLSAFPSRSSRTPAPSCHPRVLAHPPPQPPCRFRIPQKSQPWQIHLPSRLVDLQHGPVGLALRLVCVSRLIDERKDGADVPSSCLSLLSLPCQSAVTPIKNMTTPKKIVLMASGPH